MKQHNPYEIEKIGLMIKCKVFDGDQSCLNRFCVRGRVSIEEIERDMLRLSNIEDDIKKWEAIHKVAELKNYYNMVDNETKNIIKFELIDLYS